MPARGLLGCVKVPLAPTHATGCNSRHNRLPAPLGILTEAAAKEAVGSIGFQTDFEGRLAAAWAAVEALRIAEPRLGPWIEPVERVLKRWAPGR